VVGGRQVVRWRRSDPYLSVILIVFRMPRQATNTLASLLPPYQRGVSHKDYEIIVVENESDQMLEADLIEAMGRNVRYLRREEPSQSPAAAINAGVSMARARHVAIMVDGARMVTPGLIRNLLAVRRLGKTAVGSVPGYHLGSKLHQEAVKSGYDETVEQSLLAEIGWPADGYRLFEQAVLSASCERGYLVPLAESNCLMLSRRLFGRVGGCDERFTTPGGGYVNLDLYKRVVESPGVQLYVLPGEGTFHQYHGGATTGSREIDRDALMPQLAAEYQTLRGGPYQHPAVPSSLFGTIPDPALPFLAHSLSAKTKEWQA